MTDRPEIVPFEPWHLDAIEWRDGLSLSVDKEWARAMMEQYRFVGRSGRVGEKIIGAAGVLLLGGGQAYATVVVSHAIEKHRVWFHRAVRRGFLDLIREHGLKYVFCWTLEGSRCDARWLEALGFAATGAREHGEDGRAYLKYAAGGL